MNAFLVIVVLILTTFNSTKRGSINCSFPQPTSSSVVVVSSSFSLENSLSSLERDVASSAVVDTNVVDRIVSPFTLPVAEAANWTLRPEHARGTRRLTLFPGWRTVNGANDNDNEGAADGANDNVNEGAADGANDNDNEGEEDDEEVSLCFFFVNSINLFPSLTHSSSSSLIERSRSPRR